MKFIITIGVETHEVRSEKIENTKDVVKINKDGVHFWILGTGIEFDPDKFVSDYLRNRNVKEVAAGLSGDYLIIVSDKEIRKTFLINDKTGKYRLYHSLNNGELILTSQIFDHVLNMPTPTFNQRGLYQIITSSYYCDPDTIVNGVNSVPVCYFVEYNEKGSKDVRYFNNVKFEDEHFQDEATSIEAMDNAFLNIFEQKFAKKSPVVFLSGGIDSLTLMHYTKEVIGKVPDTLTYCSSGLTDADLQAAKVAAKYYGSNHNILEMENENSWSYFLDGLMEGDSISYANIITNNIKKHYETGSGEVFITGQDTRLHTPGLDYGMKLGINYNVLEKGTALEKKMVRSFSKALTFWPYKGKMLFNDFARKVEELTAEEYFENWIRRGVHFTGKEFEYGDFFDSERVTKNFTSQEFLFKSFLTHFMLTQLTDNANEEVSQLECSGHEVHLPLTDSRFLEVANRLPFHLSTKAIFSLKSGSMVPVVRKYLVRKLLKNKVPVDLLNRKKDTPLPVTSLISDGFIKNAKFIINANNNEFLEHLDTRNREVAQTVINDIQKVTKESLKYPLFRQLHVFVYLIILLRIMKEKNYKVIEDLKRL